MNEIYSYDPETYHATLTHSVFVRLEGGTLRLSKPNKNISRRASYNETKPEVTYISQKIYDLSDSKVSLGDFGSRARMDEKHLESLLLCCVHPTMLSKEQYTIGQHLKETESLGIF